MSNPSKTLRLIKIRGVKGFHSIRVRIIPSLGMVYTTGVMYMTKRKISEMNLATSVYNIPKGVTSKPNVIPAKIRITKVSGKKSMFQLRDTLKKRKKNASKIILKELLNKSL